MTVIPNLFQNLPNTMQNPCSKKIIAEHNKNFARRNKKENWTFYAKNFPPLIAYHSVWYVSSYIFKEEQKMKNSALVVIDLQNDITKNYREIIARVNQAVDWAAASGMHVVYIQNQNLSAGTRTFKPGTHGAELVPEMKIASDHIFIKTKSNALTSEDFATFIQENAITEFFIAGADATACVKSTCFNMKKSGYTVHVISDCITSYNKNKIPEMLAYYESKGCDVRTFDEMSK